MASRRNSIELVEIEETSLSKMTRIGLALRFQAETLMKTLRERVFGSLPFSVIYMSKENGKLSLEALLLFYCDILEYHGNCLFKLRAVNEEGEFLLKELLYLVIVTECHVIFFTNLRKNQVLEKSLKMVDTQYSIGARAKLLIL